MDEIGLEMLNRKLNNYEKYKRSVSCDICLLVKNTTYPFLAVKDCVACEICVEEFIKLRTAVICGFACKKVRNTYNLYLSMLQHGKNRRKYRKTHF